MQQPAVTGMDCHHTKAALFGIRRGIGEFIDGAFNDLLCHRTNDSFIELAFNVPYAIPFDAVDFGYKY